MSAICPHITSAPLGSGSNHGGNPRCGKLRRTSSTRAAQTITDTTMPNDNQTISESPSRDAACSAWIRSQPAHEGFWAWKSSANVKDMAKWRIFFVERKSQFIRYSDASKAMTFWELQTNTCPPRGGWWMLILPNADVMASLPRASDETQTKNTDMPNDTNNTAGSDCPSTPCSLNAFGRPIWIGNPECPACGTPMEFPTDNRDLERADWECVHPGPHQPKRLFLDYELTMILRARLKKISEANVQTEARDK